MSFELIQSCKKLTLSEKGLVKDVGEILSKTVFEEISKLILSFSRFFFKFTNEINLFFKKSKNESFGEKR